MPNFTPPPNYPRMPVQTTTGPDNVIAHQARTADLVSQMSTSSVAIKAVATVTQQRLANTSTIAAAISAGRFPKRANSVG